MEIVKLSMDDLLTDIELTDLEFTDLDEIEKKAKLWCEVHGHLIKSENFPEAITYYNDKSDKNFICIKKILCYVDNSKFDSADIEFLYIYSGKICLTIGKDSFSYATGSFIVIPPNTVYQVSVLGNSLCLSITMSRDYFFSLHVPNTALYVLPLIFPCTDDLFVKRMILALLEQDANNLQYRNEMMMHLFSALMVYLMQVYSKASYPLSMSGVKNVKTLQMVNYIFEHYNSITLQALAEEFHYNESYLSTVIRNGTGKTFTENLREFRMVRAEEILRNTPNIKLSMVCDQIGYNDMVRFIRDFKAKYKITPGKYKTLLKKDSS